MIKMDRVRKQFGEQTVLFDVSFDVCEREIFGLLGPSGAGKTTIINILTNQLDADGGSHEIGVRPFDVGLMLDEDGLFPRLNCLENLNVFAQIYGMPHSKSLEALRSVGLLEAAKKAVNTLSKGMRQRLALARAILHRPKVLFLDEPTSGIDPATARGIHKLIMGLRDKGATVFLTTHNMEEAVKLCDRVVLLHKGRIVEQGSPSEICRRHDAVKTVSDLEAIFTKQLKDTIKNRIILIQFILFPAMAFIMTEFVAKSDETMPNSIFVTMFAAMFAGMTPLMLTNTIIAEDKEHKSLKFLVMAGVKPHHYLLGVGGFVLISCSVVAVFFGLISGLGAIDAIKFSAVLILGCLTSVIVGATIGIYSKNQQSAAAIGTPIFMLLAFIPMLTMFNETLSKIAFFLYTQQVRELVLSFDLTSGVEVSVPHALLVIVGNTVFISLLFILSYKKKGLRG